MTQSEPTRAQILLDYNKTEADVLNDEVGDFITITVNEATEVDGTVVEGKETQKRINLPAKDVEPAEVETAPEAPVEISEEEAN